MKVCNVLAKFIPNKLKRNIINAYMKGIQNDSMSQEGEDLVLKRIFSNLKQGTYLDIGSHHPHRFSNTFLLNKLGWHGFNIDANPWSIEQFQLHRPTDINLNIALGQDGAELSYFLFDEPAINTCDALKAEDILKNTHYTLVKKETVTTLSVSTLLKLYPDMCSIDLLNVDIEGFDEMIISQINWSILRPKVIIVEGPFSSIEDSLNDYIGQTLKSKDYVLFSKFFRSRIYISSDYYTLNILKP